MAKRKYVPIVIMRGLKDAAVGLALFVMCVLLATADDGSSGGAAFDGLFSVRATAAEVSRTPTASATPAASVISRQMGTHALVTSPRRSGHTVETLPGNSSRQAALILMAAVFSALMAFNLAFFRHLTHVYGKPSRH